MPEEVSGLPFWFCKATALLVGAAMGSFANVLIHRVPRGENIARPGSRCPGCGAAIRGYDNIPVLSWVILLGRCRRCRQPISMRYPMVELIMAVLSLASLYLAVTWSMGLGTPAQLAALWFFPFSFCFLLLVITFVDLEHWRIPPVFTVTGAAIGVLGAFAVGTLSGVTWMDSLIGLAVGGLGLAAITEIWFLVTKREGLGYGDVFLLGMIGASLGYRSLPLVLLFASLQGLAVAVPYLLLGGRATPPWAGDEAAPADSPDVDATVEPAEGAASVPVDATEPAPRMLQAPIPFGPFLALGALEWLFFGEAVWQMLVP